MCFVARLPKAIPVSLSHTAGCNLRLLRAAAADTTGEWHIFLWENIPCLNSLLALAEQLVPDCVQHFVNDFFFCVCMYAYAATLPKDQWQTSYKKEIQGAKVYLVYCFTLNRRKRMNLSECTHNVWHPLILMNQFSMDGMIRCNQDEGTDLLLIN